MASDVRGLGGVVGFLVMAAYTCDGAVVLDKA